MINTFWRDLRKYHANKTSSTEKVIDYIAVFEILRLCATGISNADIADMLSIEEYYVKETILEFLDFPGFRSNLAYSPYRFYKVARSFLVFQENLLGTYPDSDKKLARILWDLCDTVYIIEKEINSYG